MELINVLLQNPVQVVLSVVALLLSGYAAVVVRDNKREIQHHKKIDEALHGQMIQHVDGVAENLTAFSEKWERESERDRDQRGKMWESINAIMADVAFLKGRAEKDD